MNSALVVKVLRVILFATVIQVCRSEKEPNCLKSNPRVLHSIFEWYDKDVDPWIVTESDVQSMIQLFSTRFDRAYVINGIPSSDWLPIALSVAKLRADSKSEVQLYLRTHPGNDGNGRNETIKILKGYYDMIRNVHKVDNGTIAGLLLWTNLKTYQEDLEVYEEVFGPLEAFKEFSLGTLIKPGVLSKKTTAPEYLKKVKFIVVSLDVKPAERPKISADQIIITCDYLQANARLKGISAEVLCYTGYPVTGTDVNGLEGSLDGFQRFWCRIVESLKSGNGHARIIMRGAFDESLTAISDSNFKDPSAKLKFGWWRRNNLLSSHESDFDEKVEALENISNFKPQGKSKCSWFDSSYLVGVFVILIIQFGLTVYTLVISRRCWNYFKKLSQNSKRGSIGTHIFEMETSSN